MPPTAGTAAASLPALLGLVLLTQLGDAWFVLALAGWCYWAAPEHVRAPRRLGLVVGALGLAAFGTTALLKPLFAAPRPPGAATISLPSGLPGWLAAALRYGATETGYGLPSGHAVTATVVYGGGSLLIDRGSRRVRATIATLLVVTVGATRVGLGVHAPIDVVVGVVVGCGLLVGVTTDRLPGPPIRRENGAVHPRRPLVVAGVTLAGALAVLLATGRADGGVAEPVAGLVLTGVIAAVWRRLD